MTKTVWLGFSFVAQLFKSKTYIFSWYVVRGTGNLEKEPFDVNTHLKRRK